MIIQFQLLFKELYYVFHYSLVLLVVPGMVISMVVVLSIVLVLALVILRPSVTKKDNDFKKKSNIQYIY